MKILTLVVLLFLITFAAAQENSLLKKNQYSINLGVQGLQLNAECRMGKNNILQAGVGFGLSMVSQMNANKYLDKVYHSQRTTDVAILPTAWLAPFLYIENRNYYNLQSRLKKGKSINSNSGNYWGFRGKVFTNAVVQFKDKKPKYKSNYRLGAFYGLQRTFGAGRNWLFNVDAGAGLWSNYNFSFISAGPMLNTSIGFIL